MSLWAMFYETVFGFVALYILTKILGKTQISQLTAFDFIAALVLGELVGNALFDEKATILHIGFAIVLWGGLLYITEMITQKFKRSRNLLEGRPVFLIYKGDIMYGEMKKSKIDIGELQHLLREKSTFSVQEVEHAILETNGEVSVMKKFPFQTATKTDVNALFQSPEIATTIISDGEILYDNLRELQVDKTWLDNELNNKGFVAVKDVLFAEYMQGKDLFIQPYTRRRDGKRPVI